MNSVFKKSNALLSLVVVSAIGFSLSAQAAPSRNTAIKGNVNQCLSLMLSYHDFSRYIPEVRSEILSGPFGEEILNILDNKDVLSETALFKLRRDDRVRVVESCRRLLHFKQNLGGPLFEIESNLRRARETIALYKYEKEGNAVRFRNAVSSALFDMYEAEQFFMNSRFHDNLLTKLLDQIRSAQSHLNSGRAFFEKQWMISNADQIEIIGHLNNSLKEIENAIALARVERFRSMPRQDGQKESFISWLTWPVGVQVP